MLLQLVSKTLFIFVAYLTCCIWARSLSPSQYHRPNANNVYNSINTFPELGNWYSPMEDEVYQPLPQLRQQPQYEVNNVQQWDRAQEPLNYYDPTNPATDDFYDQLGQGSFSDIEAFSNLLNMYDEPMTAPVYGQILNRKPEYELEALKAEERQREAEQRELQEEQALMNKYKMDYEENFNHQDKRASSQFGRQPVQSQPSPAQSHQEQNVASVTSAPTGTTSQPLPVATTPASSASSSSTLTKSKVTPHTGQKEVPMLRPPTKPKQQQTQQAGDDEPVIQVVQRSSDVEKPSAYDTLRKYLSLEDALKKEAEKRRVQKRASPSTTSSGGKKQIISDVESLSGQLKNLKKTPTV